MTSQTTDHIQFSARLIHAQDYSHNGLQLFPDMNMLDNSVALSSSCTYWSIVCLQVLNEKFSGDIEAIKPHMFPDAYFTCPERCLACG